MNSWYKVYIKTVAGPYTQYDGWVEVLAADDEEAGIAAIRKLTQGSRAVFKNWSAEMFRVIEVKKHA